MTTHGTATSSRKPNRIREHLDAQGRLLVCFVGLGAQIAHARQRNRERRAQAETQRFVRQERAVAHV